MDQREKQDVTLKRPKNGMVKTSLRVEVYALKLYYTVVFDTYTVTVRLSGVKHLRGLQVLIQCRIIV